MSNNSYCPKFHEVVERAKSRDTVAICDCPKHRDPDYHYSLDYKHRSKITNSSSGHAKFEPLHVANKAIKSFSCGTPHRQVLKRWDMIKKDLLECICTHDLSKVVSVTTMQELLRIFSKIFFYDALDDIEFKWEHTLLDNNTLGQAWRDPNQWPHSKIEMAPQVGCQDWELHSPKRLKKLGKFIGTLLHEAIHSFQLQFNCMDCKSCKEYSRSHGRAFQLHALAIEEVSEFLLGIKVDTGRRRSLITDVVEEDHPPLSMCDLVTYKFL